MERKDLPLPVLKRQIERMTIMHLRSEKRRLEKLKTTAQLLKFSLIGFNSG